MIRPSAISSYGQKRIEFTEKDPMSRYVFVPYLRGNIIEIPGDNPILCGMAFCHIEIWVEIYIILCIGPAYRSMAKYHIAIWDPFSFVLFLKIRKHKGSNIHGTIKQNNAKALTNVQKQ